MFVDGKMYNIINIWAIEQNRSIQNVTVKGELKNDYYVVTIIINVKSNSKIIAEILQV